MGLALRCAVARLSTRPALPESLWLLAPRHREADVPSRGRVGLGGGSGSAGGGRELTVHFYEQRKERRGEASPSSPVTPVKVPDCPVPASLLEELLRPPPAVSKEPLRNLNSCLQQLKYGGSSHVA